MPEGFKKVETDTASWEIENGVPKGWNNGLVIEDEIGNQFVWVKAKETREPEENDDIKEQINKYGGFYVARYEVGIPKQYIETIGENEIRSTFNNNEGIPTSKKDQIPWNWIHEEKAKKNAINMYKNSNLVKSKMIQFNHWCYITDWLDNCGYNTRDSLEWGNYADSVFEFTGYYSEDTKLYKYAEKN